MNETNNAFETQSRQNLSLSEKKMQAFLKEAAALRSNLKKRQKQQKERQSKCMHSK